MSSQDSDLQDKDLAEIENSTLDAFYQRMFDRDIYLHVSEISVVMLGVCLTGVSILNVDQESNNTPPSFGVDDLLALDSIIFLVAYLISYWVVRVMTKGNRNVRRIGNFANGIFLVGMILMAIVCVSIVARSDYISK